MIHGTNQTRNIAEVNASSATSKVTIIGINTKEMMTPAIASPRGCLNRPMNENMTERIHISQPIKGTQPMNTLTNDSTKPAVPIPFDLC